MSDTVLVVLVVAGMVLALAFGIWAGLGYPGLYDRYEPTGKASRLSPFEQLMDWLVRRWDR